MTASELKQKYFDFFIQKKHLLIPNVSLIPENDSSALFVSAGMHPLVPYLLGEKHSLGKRLVSVQKCLRTDDIEEVGDAVHHTFFEMLGNWSLGDPASPDGIGQGGYFKKEMISWSFEFLTSKNYLGIPLEKLATTVFAGDQDIPFDQESYDLWISQGIPVERIARLPKENNWWGPVGNIGPCGPDTEIFYWTGEEEAPKCFDPNDTNWVEIWNDVFMEYEKKIKNKDDFEIVSLKQKNVDTGMGLERTLAIMNNLVDDYRTELFWPIILKLQELSNKKYEDHLMEFRVIADHLRGAVVLINEGLEPSNKQQGYILRRLIRRSAVKMRALGIDIRLAPAPLTMAVIEIFADNYLTSSGFNHITAILDKEIKAFSQNINNGIKILKNHSSVDGIIAFKLFQSYGFPLEITLELLKDQKNDEELEKIKSEFYEEQKKHQELSKTASSGMFKGGLIDHSEIVTKYHTAAHLLQAVLRQILGDDVHQKGSNLTSERLRFDFSYQNKLTSDQLSVIEAKVNEQIKQNLPVTMEILDFKKALEDKALIVPGEKYPEKVKVYSIKHFSKEICGGPHVDFTGKLGEFKIIKEESAGAGIRRIYAILI